MSVPIPLFWSVAPSPGHTLFLLFAYHGRDRDVAAAGPARGHLIVHRDHYANPRTLAYQLAMIATASQQLSPQSAPDIVIDRAFGPNAAIEPAGRFGRVEVADLTRPHAWRPGLATDAARYENVVLVFPDALGLGCEPCERRLLRDRNSVLVINGRRRVFALTTRFAYRLDVSRWLARSRAVERTLAVAIRPLGATLAMWDRLRGRAA